MRPMNTFAALIFFVITGVSGGIAYWMYRATANIEAAWIAIVGFMIALIFALAIKVAAQWERAVVLRLGKFRELKGPGLFFIIPVIDSIPYWIDMRVITGSFKAEKTLTKDTVPVDVDAVLFWKVLDPQKAALDVADYRSAISWESHSARFNAVMQFPTRSTTQCSNIDSFCQQEYFCLNPNPSSKRRTLKA